MAFLTSSIVMGVSYGSNNAAFNVSQWIAAGTLGYFVVAYLVYPLVAGAVKRKQK